MQHWFDDTADREAALRRYLRSLATVPNLRAEQRETLARRAVAGDEDAKQLLVAMSARLVVSLAKQYLGHGLLLFDLIAAGNTGLAEAVAHYDPEGTEPFSVQAQFWIRAALQRAIEQPWKD